MRDRTWSTIMYLPGTLRVRSTTAAPPAYRYGLDALQRRAGEAAPLVNAVEDLADDVRSNRNPARCRPCVPPRLQGTAPRGLPRHQRVAQPALLEHLGAGAGIARRGGDASKRQGYHDDRDTKLHAHGTPSS